MNKVYNILYPIIGFVSFQNQPEYRWYYNLGIAGKSMIEHRQWMSSPQLVFALCEICFLYHFHLQQIDLRHCILASRSIIHLSLFYTWLINSQLWLHQKWRRMTGLRFTYYDNFCFHFLLSRSHFYHICF